VNDEYRYIKKVKNQGHWERKSKNIVFLAYFLEKWIDLIGLHQANTEMIYGPFYIYNIILYISTAKKAY